MSSGNSPQRIPTGFSPRRSAARRRCRPNCGERGFELAWSEWPQGLEQRDAAPAVVASRMSRRRLQRSFDRMSRDLFSPQRPSRSRGRSAQLRGGDAGHARRDQSIVHAFARRRWWSRHGEGRCRRIQASSGPTFKSSSLTAQPTLVRAA
jgi:hypothetical protein